MNELNMPELKVQMHQLLQTYKDLLEGSEEDIKKFLLLAASAMAEAVASGDRDTAQEVAGSLRVLAWSNGVKLQRENARTLSKVVFFILRSALAVVAAL